MLLAAEVRELLPCLPEGVDFTVESAQRACVGVGHEDAGLVAGTVEELGHDGRVGRHRVHPVEPTERAVLKARHERGSGRLGPRGVAVDPLEDDALPRQCLHVGRGVPGIPIEAHEVRRRTVDHVEDHVGPLYAPLGS